MINNLKQSSYHNGIHKYLGNSNYLSKYYYITCQCIFKCMLRERSKREADKVVVYKDNLRKKGQRKATKTLCNIAQAYVNPVE